MIETIRKQVVTIAITKLNSVHQQLKIIDFWGQGGEVIINDQRLADERTKDMSLRAKGPMV